MENEIYKCKNCGANLIYNPGDTKLTCQFCDSIFTPEDFNIKDVQEAKAAQEGDISTDNTDSDISNLVVYRCKICSGEIITSTSTMATTCLYCGNPIVLGKQLDTPFKPKYIIPFKIKREEAVNKYLKFIKKPLVPREFLSERYLEKIKGVYVPFWLYDTYAEGGLEIKAETISYSSDSKYNYTHHKVYKVLRDGNMKFEKIPVDASFATPDEAMDSIEPFDYSTIQEFDPQFLAGFLAERYTVESNDSEGRAIYRAKNTLRNELDKTVTGYTSKVIESEDLNVDVTNVDYALLPTYLLYSKYNDKDYLFAINGQTGKICGEVPVDKKRLILFSIGTFVLSFIIVFILSTLFGV